MPHQLTNQMAANEKRQQMSPWRARNCDLAVYNGLRFKQLRESVGPKENGIINKHVEL